MAYTQLSLKAVPTSAEELPLAVLGQGVGVRVICVGTGYLNKVGRIQGKCPVFVKVEQKN